MFSLFLTVYLWSITVVSILITSLVCLLVYPFVNQKTFSRIYECTASYIILYSMTIPGFWKLEIRDLRKDKSWKNKRYVIIANHLSFIDSLILSTLKIKKSYMIGKIFAEIPVFGWLCRSSGYVAVDRNNTELCRTAVDRAVETIERNKTSFMLYPEGLRSKNPPHFEKFKTGAYRIARKTGLEILPITLKGTNVAMPIGGRVFPATIIVTINDPFPIEHENYPFYIQETQKIMASNLE